MSTPRLRATLEAGGRVLHWPLVNPNVMDAILEEVRKALQQQARLERCASVVVSVHFTDERCDHEGP